MQPSFLARHCVKSISCTLGSDKHKPLGASDGFVCSALANLESEENATGNAKQKRRQNCRPIAKMLVNGHERCPDLDIRCGTCFQLVEIVCNPDSHDRESNCRNPESPAIIANLYGDWGPLWTLRYKLIGRGPPRQPQIEDAQEHAETAPRITANDSLPIKIESEREHSDDKSDDEQAARTNNSQSPKWCLVKAHFPGRARKCK